MLLHRVIVLVSFFFLVLDFAFDGLIQVVSCRFFLFMLLDSVTGCFALHPCSSSSLALY
ncbi:unnamed protein product [Musa acuminata subsp. malaccensis]|uniref:(wild Malaysian banana) hypothetical protein n=1 Tax=Musa acuminata subsp. malaccensis TaxID=214687 RepID=A0A804IWP3_MUSAM|nr:unnamed protein product [Musa acuminata subsp. malaccensis]